MPYIQVRGFNHYYEWITRAGREPSGKPVMVFMHGWGGSARYWESTAHALSDTFDCLLYDLRGFGRSRSNSNESTPLDDPPETPAEVSYELESYAEDLAALLNALGVNPPIYLNAHSTGASVATFFLNLYPDRVKRAVLTCSGIFEYDEKAFKAFHKFGGYVVRFRPKWLYGLPFVDRLFMQRFLHRPLSGAISRAFLEDFLMADYEAALGTILTAVSEKAAQVMPQEFARLTVPTLLVSGEYDIIIPAEMGRQAAALSKHVEHLVIANTAHFPMLEDPQTYLQHVRRFLGVPTPQPSETL